MSPTAHWLYAFLSPHDCFPVPAAQDGQLEAFMVVAQRQIKMLEGDVKDLKGFS